MGSCFKKQKVNYDEDYITTPNIEEENFEYHSESSETNYVKRKKTKSKNRYILRPGFRCYRGLTIKELRKQSTGDPRVDILVLPSLTSEQLKEVWTIRELTPYLYLCAGCAIKGFRRKIFSMGITCIINVSSELNTNVNDKRVKYIQLPVLDSKRTDLSCYFRLIANLIQANAEAGGKTIIHCVLGVSRSASLCIAYFITYYNHTVDEAFDWVRSQRFIINPNKGFRKQLELYEHNLNANIPSPLGQTFQERKIIEEIKKTTWIYRTKKRRKISGTFPFQSLTVEKDKHFDIQIDI